MKKWILSKRSWWLIGLSLQLSLNLGFVLDGAAASLTRFEFTQPQMGVAFRVVLYADNRELAESAAQAAFDRIGELNQIMSDYEEESELSRLSRSSQEGIEFPVSSELWKVLDQAQILAKKTDGAFDVTVGPYVDLWKRARRQRELPAQDRLAEFGKRVGYQNLQMIEERQAVRLRVPRMRLDLGGIAKGFAVDAAMRTLRDRGIERAMVGGDGDILVSAPPPGRTAWRIAIADLDTPEAPEAPVVWLRNAAISTSGDLAQRVEIDGIRYSHIVDPRTGVGLTDHSLVTIIAPDSTTADSMATAVSVLGPAAGLKLVHETPGAEARIARKPGDIVEVFESNGFGRFRENAKERLTPVDQ